MTERSIPLIYQLLSIVFYGLTIKILYDLKKTNCKCSDDSRHNYVLYYMYYTLAMIILGIFGLKLHKHIPYLFVFILLIYTITMCFITTLYLRTLSQPECGCETTDLQKYIRYIWYFNSAMMVLMIIGGIFMVITWKPKKN
jgi:undecaprenyl pyrophosphate phosphatase UppP